MEKITKLDAESIQVSCTSACWSYCNIDQNFNYNNDGLFLQLNRAC